VFGSVIKTDWEKESDEKPGKGNIQALWDKGETNGGK